MGPIGLPEVIVIVLIGLLLIAPVIIVFVIVAIVKKSGKPKVPPAMPRTQDRAQQTKE